MAQPPSTTTNPRNPIYFQLAMSPIPPSQPASSSSSPEYKHVTYPTPKLRIHLNDLSHDGTTAFLSSLEPSKVLADAVATVLRLLYELERSANAKQHNGAAKQTLQTDANPTLTTSSTTGTPTRIRDDTAIPSPPSTSLPEPTPTAPVHHALAYPPVRSITLILSQCGGVASTNGIDLDFEHKEIHFDLNHILRTSPEHRKNEMLGVLVHEMVHCWQWSGKAPTGLIEGIADWVRLNAGLAPPHWKRHKSDTWDAGYETTGYFLDWLERHKCGEGAVRNLNAWLRKNSYDKDAIWHDLCGHSIEKLWQEYSHWLEEQEVSNKREVTSG